MDTLYKLTNKKVDIVKEPWDFLVILDTCRYDIFKQVYRDFFKCGKLKRALSPANHTREWLIKCFPDKYEDIVYISGNPNINSKIVMKSGGKVFSAKEHFFKIIDVWNYGWDESIGQVPPKQINKAFHKYYLKYPNKRFILHYQQPHFPWISIGGEPKSFQDKYKKIYNNAVKRIKKRHIIKEIIPHVFWWKLHEILKTPPESNREKHYRLYGRKGMIDAYTKDLELGLKHVKFLTDYIDGYWLITADHGEQLGELGIYAHPPYGRLKKQYEVPWFEIR